jgi:enterochelin esterase family protein
MIVVMPIGYGAPEILANGWRLDDSELWMKNIRRFADTLLDEVIPQVEREYPVRKDRDSRAISGLSMGGAETLYVGLSHPEKFAYVAPLSAATFNNPDLFLPNFNAREVQKLKLLWIACGKQDHLIQNNRQFEQWLTSKNVKFTAVEVDGAAHTWPLWRRNLIALAPLLFR